MSQPNYCPECKSGKVTSSSQKVRGIKLWEWMLIVSLFFLGVIPGIIALVLYCIVGAHVDEETFYCHDCSHMWTKIDKLNPYQS